MRQFVPNFISYVLCQILFELVCGWESYHESKKANLLLRHSVVRFWRSWVQRSRARSQKICSKRAFS